MDHIPPHPTQTNPLDAAELSRLVRIQQRSHDLIDRRVEHLGLLLDHHVSARVTQQVRVPAVLPSEVSGTELPTVLIPLGYFGKELRADLKVCGPDGLVLPVLSRAEQAKTIAVLFTSGWQSTFLDGVDGEHAAEALALWDRVQHEIRFVVIAPTDPARAKIDELRSALVAFQTTAGDQVKAAITRVLVDGSFWSELAALAETELLIARASRLSVGATYVFSVEFTEPAPYVGGVFRVRAGRSALLGWLGWIGVPILRWFANVGQAASFWVVQTTPDGVEPIRAYWADAAGGRPHEVAVSADRIVASRHMVKTDDASARELIMEVQMKPSSEVTTATVLAIMLWFVATYVYREVPDITADPSQQASLAGTGSLFAAAVPAVLAGLLAYSRGRLARLVIRGPRVVLGGLAVLAGFLAIVLSLTSLSPSWVEALSVVVLTYACVATGVLGYVQFGPRWRQIGQSGGLTTKTTPEQARARQLRCASAFAVLWLLGTVVVVRCEVVLRQTDIITSEFPGNLWHAWWSWFGL